MRVRIITRHGETWRYRIVCVCCGNGFFTTRNDAKTCSNACRQKLYRRRQKQARKKHRQKCVQLGLFPPETAWSINQRVFNL